MLPKPVKRKKKRRAFQPSSSKSHSMARADLAFSYFIRQRDANEDGICTCISCGEKSHWTNTENGHYIGRSNQRLRYDEQNCAAQCSPCNRAGCGKSNSIFRVSRFGMYKRTKDVKRKHRKGLKARYGEDILDVLQERGRPLQKTSREHFDEITRKYRDLCEENGWLVG